eukprot:TRINITY_DN3514_c0_g1_i7.p1 TRINITY_DN3514_c0_g1~~TRINITY_DN3514_c0_g1_i7.p1  ORF type:complete len:150 (-),score=46.56 TRINITY_DN3514_c0_g1_i7:233-682(-)
MFVHHNVTLYLIVASYLMNYTRYGALFTVIHDFSDIFLYWAKVSHYTKSMAKDMLFVVFAGSFGISRLIVYPAVIWSYWFESPQYIPMEWSPEKGHFANGFVRASVIPMVTLFCLHIYWFYLIMGMVIEALTKGEIGQDVRSDDESDDE